MKHIRYTDAADKPVWLEVDRIERIQQYDTAPFNSEIVLANGGTLHAKEFPNELLHKSYVDSAPEYERKGLRVRQGTNTYDVDTATGGDLSSAAQAIGTQIPPGTSDDDARTLIYRRVESLERTGVVPGTVLRVPDPP